MIVPTSYLESIRRTNGVKGVNRTLEPGLYTTYELFTTAYFLFLILSHPE